VKSCLFHDMDFDRAIVSSGAGEEPGVFFLVRFSDGRKYLSVAMCVWLLALLHMSLPFWFPTMRYPMVGSVGVDGSSLMYLYYSP
jgi:hypothetical protein